MSYQPPFTRNDEVVTLIANISDKLGRY